MLARHYVSADSDGLDAMLAGSGNVRLDCDRLVCVGAPGRPVGLLAWRPGGIVHELRVASGLGQRAVADALVNFSVADSVSHPHMLHEAIFVCDTDSMAKYVGELGAIEESGKRVFTLKLR